MAIRFTVPGMMDAIRPRATPPSASRVLRGDGVSPSVEEALFQSLRLQNGTWKVTGAGRLTDVDNLIGRHLPATDPLRICDVGISSGITTAEWFQDLQARGRAFSMTGIDRDLNGFLIDVGGFMTVLADRTGFPLQYSSRVAVHGIATHRDRLRQPLRRVASHALVARATKAARRDAVTESRSFGVRVRCEPVLIVSPRLTKLPVTLEERDVRDLAASTFDVVRVANVLNRSYFSDDTLRRMIATLLASLRPDGILVIARSPSDQANIATIFRASPGHGLEIVARLGGGHEIEGLVYESSEVVSGLGALRSRVPG
jgi:SAM-dependent methyltransferase